MTPDYNLLVGRRFKETYGVHRTYSIISIDVQNNNVYVVDLEPIRYCTWNLAMTYRCIQQEKDIEVFPTFIGWKI